MEHNSHEIKVLESTPSYGKINIEPLERGYGVTLGNSLRRVLLSSISGASVVAVRIDGVLHEFSTIKGVKEDVIEVLVNFKHIPIRSHAQEVRVLHLEVEAEPGCGSRAVTARDIAPDSEIEFPQEDSYICTLEEGHKVVMDIYVSTGTGYSRVDRERPAYLPVDALLTDALFSPVQRVKYDIQDKRMGQRTDYDSLTVEIWTNGVVSPEDAVLQAARILKGYYASIVDAVAGAGQSDLDDLAARENGFRDGRGYDGMGLRSSENAILARHVKDLELSIRSENCLQRGGVHLIGELVAKTRDDLLKIRNLGKISLKEIEEKLAKFDLTLSGDVSSAADDPDEADDEHNQEDD